MGQVNHQITPFRGLSHAKHTVFVDFQKDAGIDTGRVGTGKPPPRFPLREIDFLI